MKKVAKDIKDSLVAQLNEKSMNFAAFLDLIDDYITLWEIKEKLRKDVKTRGVTYKELNVKGTEIEKENPSVRNLINTNKQMLQILEKLELDPKKAIPSKEGIDEDL